MITDESAKQLLKIEREKFCASTDSLALNWNNQFTQIPENFDGKNAVLLIHGFLGSPYFMRDMADTYFKLGYLVHAVRLPGHGVAPEALEGVTYQDWQKHVDDAATALKLKAENLHICGFSLGASLGVLIDPKQVASYCLIAPAFQPMGLIKFAQFISFLGLKKGYSLTRKFTPCHPNRVMYDYYPLSILKQVSKAGKKSFYIRYKRTEIATFYVGSNEDHVVNMRPMLGSFLMNDHPAKQARIYNQLIAKTKRPNMTLVCLSQIDGDVDQMSHVAYTFKPDNPYFGKGGEYYGDVLPGTRYGEGGPSKLYNNKYKRLTFNPDFDGLTQQLVGFLEKLNSSDRK